jgi:hypothetical protein
MEQQAFDGKNGNLEVGQITTVADDLKTFQFAEVDAAIGKWMGSPDNDKVVKRRQQVNANCEMLRERIAFLHKKLAPKHGGGKVGGERLNDSDSDDDDSGGDGSDRSPSALTVPVKICKVRPWWQSCPPRHRT